MAKMMIERIQEANGSEFFESNFSLNSFGGNFAEALWAFSDSITELTGKRPDLCNVKISHESNYKACGFKLHIDA